MIDLRYEQTWFRIICRHSAPPQLKASVYWEKRQASVMRRIEVANEKDGGKSTKEIAKERGWSVAHTQTMIRVGRFYREFEARRSH